MKKYIILLLLVALGTIAYSQTNVYTNSDKELEVQLVKSLKSKTVSDPIQEIIFDQLVAVTPGQKLTYKAWAKSLSGPFMLRIHCTYYDASNTLKGDCADQTWILSDVYTEHIYVMPPVPTGTAKVNIGFRAYRSDGARFPVNSVTCIIDDVQLNEEITTTTSTLNVKSDITYIYPNPVIDRLSVVSDNVIKNVSIYNMSGQKEKEVFDNYNSFIVSELNSGMYLVKINLESGYVTQKMYKK